MPKRYVVAGSTGQSFNVFLQSTSNGDPVISMTTDKVKVAYAIGTSGAVTTVALQSTTRAASWVSGGWVENSSVEMPGVYRLDLPDAALASTPGVTFTVRCSTPSTNFGTIAAEIQVISSAGADMPADFITYRGMAQTSVNIGAMLTSMNADLTSVESRLTSMDTMLTSVNTVLTSVNTNVNTANTRLTSVDNHVTSIDSRLTSMDAMLTSVNTNVNTANTRLTSVDTKVTSINTVLTSVNTVLTSVNTNVNTIVSQVSSIEANTTALIAGVVVQSIANNAITAAAIASNAITTAELASGVFTQISDSLLDRDMSAGTDSGSSSFRTPRQALRFLRNKWAISGTTLTVHKEDDSAASWTAVLTTNSAADPISAVDPA